MQTFRKELTELINRYSIENGSNTPDFVLSQYICEVLKAYEVAISNRDRLKGAER